MEFILISRLSQAIMNMYFIKRNFNKYFIEGTTKKDLVKVDELRYQVRYKLRWGEQGKNQEHPCVEVFVHKHLKGDTCNRKCNGKMRGK